MKQIFITNEYRVLEVLCVNSVYVKKTRFCAMHQYEIAEELGLSDKVKREGWGGLSAEETGRIGGLMTKRKKLLKMPSNDEILGRVDKNKK